MDSLTQLALGASVAVAVMGRRTAVWKAALWGGVAGTLPDLDALIDHGDAVLNMVLHRADTHALFYLLLAAGPLGWLIARLHGEGAQWRRWWLAMTLVLVTHTLLDAMTVYGTQLLLPFTDNAYGVGSVYIIDPAYTLPLLLGVVLALVWRRAGARANHWALAVSTLYLGWGVVAQTWVSDHARASLAQADLAHERLLVTPAPFSTVLWRVVAVDGAVYHEGYYSLLDRGRPIAFRAHDRASAVLPEHQNHPQVQRIARFSDGFYRLREANGELWLTDLRMGQEPFYVFEFNIGPPLQRPTDPWPAAQRRGQRVDLALGLPWLRARMAGADLPPLSDWVSAARLSGPTPLSYLAHPTPAATP